jgi:hypothetical protein
VAARVSEASGTLVAEEVVAGDDLVHLQALRARISLTDVALEQALLVENRGALAVVQQMSVGETAA